MQFHLVAIGKVKYFICLYINSKILIILCFHIYQTLQVVKNADVCVIFPNNLIVFNTQTKFICDNMNNTTFITHMHESYSLDIKILGMHLKYCIGLLALKCIDMYAKKVC